MPSYRPLKPMMISLSALRAITLVLALATSALAADWPHWRGPNRNGVTPESSGWDEGRWPLTNELWRAEVGEGSSSPVVADGRLYSLSWRDGRDVVRCLEAESGKPLWEQSYACPRYGRKATGDQGIYSGPSSTPEFDRDSGLLFTLSVDGDLHAWDTRSEGAKVWGINLYETYDVPRRPKVGRSGLRDYGFTSSPLVIGDHLIVEVGAAEGNLMAFDKRSGEERWRSQDASPPGHNGGPVPITVENVPCVAVHNFAGLLVVRIDPGHEGQTVATYPWITSFANNIATVAVQDHFVVMTSSYNQHKIAKLAITLGGATKVWEQEEASKVCSPVIHNGHVYWAWQQVTCLDFETGKVRWRGSRVGDPGSCIATADDRLIVWGGRGELSLIESARRSPDQCKVLASQKLLTRTDAWPHVVLANQRLYCKDRHGTLICLKLMAPQN